MQIPSLGEILLCREGGRLASALPLFLEEVTAGQSKG